MSRAPCLPDVLLPGVLRTQGASDVEDVLMTRAVTQRYIVIGRIARPAPDVEEELYRRRFRPEARHGWWLSAPSGAAPSGAAPSGSGPCRAAGPPAGPPRMLPRSARRCRHA